MLLTDWPMLLMRSPAWPTLSFIESLIEEPVSP
jgi:hypothetical protein